MQLVVALKVLDLWSSTSARQWIEDLDGHFVSSKIEVKINNRLMIPFSFEDLTENS